MTQSIRDAAQSLLNSVREPLDDPERMEYTLPYKALEDLHAALSAPQPTADERVAEHMRMVEEYVEDSIGFATMPGHASIEAAERAEDRCFNKRGEIMQSARALLSASQEDAEHALRVMRLLDSGEWSLHRCMPHPSFTDEYNANSAWFVRREAAPFCDPAGNRNWSGRTAIAAFDAALAAMSAKETK